MTTKRESQAPKPTTLHATDAAAIAGELAGAVVGSAAGPVGALAGMMIGAVAGTIVGEGLEADHRRKQSHDKELDLAIGVQGGAIGAARPGAPPARIDAFSAASSGAASHGPAPAEGPMQDIDVDD
jgi:hypothetical protein